QLQTTRTVFSIHLSFRNDSAPTEIYTLSLHDALPIYQVRDTVRAAGGDVEVFSEPGVGTKFCVRLPIARGEDEASLSSPRRETRSEEHTSELQSRENLVCRLLLEKKKNTRSERTVDKG